MVEILHPALLKALFHYGWKTITELTRDGRDTKDLQDVFLMAFAKDIVVSRENGNIKITPKLEDALSYLTEFTEGVDSEKLVLVVDSYQPFVKFDAIFQRPVRRKLWSNNNGDPLGTNKMQLIVCDTAHWGSYDFLSYRNLQVTTRSLINQVVEEFPPSCILIASTNKRMSQIIKRWIT